MINVKFQIGIIPLIKIKGLSLMDYINATDKELGELVGESRQQFTRWRTGQRSLIESS